MDGDITLVYLNPHDLKPYKNNTRKHNPEDINEIKVSIMRDGFNDPIGIWGEENIIVEGHGRQIAAIEMGLERVPCIRLDHMTEDQRKEYAVRHNRTAELSDWDKLKLDIEIAELQLKGIDLSDLFDDGNGADDKDEQKEIGEVPFTEELMLTHNYIVLYFDNDFDWEVAQEKFGIKKVKDLIPRKGQPTGIGRVISGKEVLKWQN